MAALKLENGDYVKSGNRLRLAEGRDALLQRVLFKLTARRGSFPFLEELGSRLWQLDTFPCQRRQAAAQQFTAEALAEEPVSVEAVTLEEGDGVMALTARRRYEGGELAVTLDMKGKGSGLERR